MSRVSTQPSTVWRSGWLLAALIGVAALALVVSQARPTAAQMADNVELEKALVNGGTDTFAIGETVTFEITINNIGDAPIAEDHLGISDIVPGLTGITADPAAPGIYDCDVDGNLVTCTNAEGAHPAETSTTITITGTAAVRGIHENQVTGGVTDVGEIAPASVGFTIESSNIAIEKTANVEQADVGEEVVFTITVTNVDGDGVVDAAESTVEINDTLPDVFEDLVDDDVDADAPYSCTVTAAAISCENDSGAHPVDATATIIITATVAADAVLGDHTNTATATATGQAAIGNATADFTIGEEIERTIAIVKRIDGDDAPALTSVSGTIAPHEPSEWTIDLSGDTSDIEIDGVSGDEQTVTEMSPGADWIVEYAVVSPEATCADGDQGVQEGEWSSDPAVVPAGEGSYVVCIRNTYDPADVDEHTYLLTFRWSLIAWISPDMPIEDALRGEGQNEGGTNVFDDVTVIWAWDGHAQDWLGFFTAGVDQPGANDLEMFEFGAAYWIAIEGPADISWTVMEREAGDGEEDENGED